MLQSTNTQSIRLTGEVGALVAAFESGEPFTDEQVERWCLPDNGDRHLRLTARATSLLLDAWWQEDSRRKTLIERNMGA